MKIGILTYHRSLNYGAELQALALMTFISNLGHDASIIDYWPKYRTSFWSETLALPFAQMLLAIKLRLMTCIRYGIRKRNTERFINQYMKLTSTSDKYDVAIYGSDQIWRKFNKKGLKGFDEIYWGTDTIRASKRVAYAASMGSVQIIKEEDKLFVSEHLKNFDALSCREQDLKDYCKSQFHIEIMKVIDPVFLLSSEQWNHLLPDKNVPPYNYLLYYTVMRNKKTEDIADMIHKKTGLPIIELRGILVNFHYGKRYRFTADAQEFLSLIRNASYVVASSFHGVALSLCFNKEFYYAGSSKSVNRISSLLSQVGLMNRIITSEREIDLTKTIEWQEVNRKLDGIVTISKQWLSKKLVMLS